MCCARSLLPPPASSPCRGFWGYLVISAFTSRRPKESSCLRGRVLDKASVQGADILVTDLDGRVLEGKISLPIEWPIHTTLHGARADALSVFHLHSPHATLFAITRREFHPVTLQGTMF